MENRRRNVMKRQKNPNVPKNVAAHAKKTRNVNTKISPKNVTANHKAKNAKMLLHLKVRRNATVNAKREKPRREFQDLRLLPLEVLGNLCRLPYRLSMVSAKR